MLKHLPVFLLVLGLAPLAAQVTLTNDYFPVAGDTLKTNTADSASAANIDLLTPGPDRGWYFGTPTASSINADPVADATGNALFPSADISIRTNLATRSYYETTGTTMNLVGIETSLEILPGFDIETPLNPARPTRRAPLNYLDAFSSVTSNSVTGSPDSLPPEALELVGTALDNVDSFRITTISTRAEVIDAWGTARLGDNYYQVLREKRTEDINIRLELKSGFFPWADVTATIQLVSPQLAQLLGPQPTVTTYTFWTPGSIEPVAEFVVDSETDAIELMTYKRTEVATSLGGPAFTQATIRVFPNPATDLATFEIEGLERGQYYLTLINMLGQKVDTRSFSPIGNQTRLSLDVSALPQGTYFYNLRNERGRTVATKRLQVR